jgi:bacteriorhodopsin
MFGVGTVELLAVFGGFLLLLAVVVVVARRNGVHAVQDELEVPATPAVVEERIFGPLGMIHGATMSRASAGHVTLTSRRTPTWAVFLAVVLFPWGLLLLLVKHEHALHVRIGDRADGSVVQVSGRAPKRVALEVGETLERRLAVAGPGRDA